MSSESRRRSGGDGLLATALAIATALLLIWGPEEMTRRVRQALGWEEGGAYIQAEKREGGEAQESNALERALLEAIDRREVEATLARFAAQQSRIPGYPGFDKAADYTRPRHRYGFHIDLNLIY